MGLIQVHNLPDDAHRTFKARAAIAGTSLSEYVLRAGRACRLPISSRHVTPAGMRDLRR